MKKEKQTDPYRLRPMQVVGWSGRAVSLASNVIILMQITYYCTNILGLSAVLAGTLMMASKIFDGVTDLLAGVLIDKTHTRFGKARPYEFAIIGVWIFTVLLFSCPDFGTVGKAAWVFIMYSIINAIFTTLLNASETVYLIRAFKYDDDRNKLISINGLVVTIACTIISMIIPQLIGTLGVTKTGWTQIALYMAIPLLILGILRFVFVKEVNVVSTKAAEDLKMKDFLETFKDKYIWILCLITILVNLIININSAVGTYFFAYIVGDIKKMTLVGMFGLVGPLALLVMPTILKRISVTNVFVGSFILGVIGNVIKGFAGANMTFIMAGSLLQTLAGLAPSYFTLLLVVYLIDYHEYQTGKRVEGAISAINSFSGKIAGGLAAGGVGLIMGIFGFDGTAATQSASALTSISALYCWIPAAIYLILIFLMKVFDIEKKMPEIKTELEKRRAIGEKDEVLL